MEEETNFISERVKSIKSGANFPMPTYVPNPDWMETQFQALGKYAEDTNLSGETRKKLEVSDFSVCTYNFEKSFNKKNLFLPRI